MGGGAKGRLGCPVFQAPVLATGLDVPFNLSTVFMYITYMCILYVTSLRIICAAMYGRAMFAIQLLIVLQLYCESLTEQAIENPCFHAPDSLNCTLIMCTRHNIVTESCQNFSSSARFEIRKFADNDQLQVFKDNSIPPYAMGVACFAVGNQVPSDHGCASCLNCEQQLSTDVCSLFCKTMEIPKMPLSSTANTHTFQLLLEATHAASQTEMPTSSIETTSPFLVLWVILIVVAALFVALIIFVLVFVIVRHRRRQNGLHGTA